MKIMQEISVKEPLQFLCHFIVHFDIMKHGTSITSDPNYMKLKIFAPLLLWIAPSFCNGSNKGIHFGTKYATVSEFGLGSRQSDII
jgi:hypothetical protein